MKETDQDNMPRRERERLRHIGEILDAAEEIFAWDGYHGASIQAIAERADFSIGKIYQHFQSKDELYDAVMNRRVNEALEWIVAAVAEAHDPRSRIRAALTAQFAYGEKHRNFIRLFMNETMGFRFRMKAAVGRNLYEKYKEYQKILVRAFEEGMRIGLFPRDEDPVELMLAYTGIAFAFATHYEEENPGCSFTALIPRIERLFYGRIWKGSPEEE